MNRLSFKDKISFILFSVFLIISAILFDFEQIILAGISFIITIIFAVLFIAIGILIGSLVSEKASSGISSIIVQLVCFTSGMYFSKELLGNAFEKICEYLPFESSVTIIKGIMNNNLEIISLRNIMVFAIYTIVILVLSIIVFKKKMISDNK